jgi:hypothetical protein
MLTRGGSTAKDAKASRRQDSTKIKAGITVKTLNDWATAYSGPTAAGTPTAQTYTNYENNCMAFSYQLMQQTVTNADSGPFMSPSTIKAALWALDAVRLAFGEGAMPTDHAVCVSGLLGPPVAGVFVQVPHHLERAHPSGAPHPGGGKLTRASACASALSLD